MISALARIEASLRVAEARLIRDAPQDLVVASYVTLGESGRNKGDNVAGIDVQLTDFELRSVRTLPSSRHGGRRYPRLPASNGWQSTSGTAGLRARSRYPPARR
ncbi:hypothetical protein [Breoghania sp.]|uniref:hypothetical protein n=1 Tax=Breoghania sp. TaxID=2065378 RepID=UPI00262153EC|nr:hypothetical protein [Breoghania sp.]MDJ0932911.1 hypothetical protein [Breoghania sp.]